MIPTLTALFDANVLFGARLRSLLMELVARFNQVDGILIL